MSATRPVDDRSYSTYQLYRAHLPAEPLKHLSQKVAIYAQEPPPPVHTVMSALHREFRERYVRVLITKEEEVLLQYDEDGAIDIDAFNETVSQIGWSETVLKIQQTVETLPCIDAEVDAYQALVYHSSDLSVASKRCDILTNHMTLLEGRTIAPHLSQQEEGEDGSAPASLNPSGFPENAVCQLLGYLASYEEIAMTAAVSKVWNRSANVLRIEYARQYAHGWKELDCRVYEAFGPSVGLDFTEVYQQMRHMRTSSKAYCKGRALFKEQLMMQFTAKPLHFFVIQIATQDFAQSHAFSYAFRKDVNDCLDSYRAARPAYFDDAGSFKLNFFPTLNNPRQMDRELRESGAVAHPEDDGKADSVSRLGPELDCIVS